MAFRKYTEFDKNTSGQYANGVSTSIRRRRFPAFFAPFLSRVVAAGHPSGKKVVCTEGLVRVERSLDQPCPSVASSCVWLGDHQRSAPRASETGELSGIVVLTTDPFESLRDDHEGPPNWRDMIDFGIEIYRQDGTTPDNLTVTDESTLIWGKGAHGTYSVVAVSSAGIERGGPGLVFECSPEAVRCPPTPPHSSPAETSPNSTIARRPMATLAASGTFSIAFSWIGICSYS